MKVEDLRKLFEQGRYKVDANNSKVEVEAFNRLCEKSKLLLWEEFKQPNSYYLQVSRLDDYVAKLTPIEQILFIALDIYQYYQNIHTNFGFDFYTQESIKTNKSNYVVDFYIESFWYGDHQELCEKRIVIECDGYDSHHTKQQRNYDVDRENDLKMNGYSVIRFTGSQIYNDPYNCVFQIIKFLMEENKQIISKTITEVEEKTEKNNNG